MASSSPISLLHVQTHHELCLCSFPINRHLSKSQFPSLLLPIAIQYLSVHPPFLPIPVLVFFPLFQFSSYPVEVDTHPQCVYLVQLLISIIPFPLLAIPPPLIRKYQKFPVPHFNFATISGFSLFRSHTPRNPYDSPTAKSPVSVNGKSHLDIPANL